MNTTKNNIKFQNSFVTQISNFSFSLTLNKPNQIFLESLLDSNILTSSRMNDKYDKISFQASNVCSIFDFLNYCQERNSIKKINYNQALKIIFCLSQQIQTLQKNNFTFFKLDMDNILVIDYEKFIYINLDSLIEIKHNKNKNSDISIFAKSEKVIYFFKPFNKNGFISPEISKISYIPCSVDFRSVYHSLAQFIFLLLFEKKINSYGVDLDLRVDLDLNLDLGEQKDVTNNRNDSDISYNNHFNYIQNKYYVHQQIIMTLKPIFYTKLYWFLLRNLSINPNNRVIFFI
jgi:hypothetical protein